MAITVKYFASLRERLKREEDLVQAGEAATVEDIWGIVGGGEELPTNILMAVNMEYVARNHPVKDGDEVAFFPPVTGG